MNKPISRPKPPTAVAERPVFTWAWACGTGSTMRSMAPVLRSLQTKLIKIGEKVVRHGRYVTFQLAEVAIPRDLFAKILRQIDGLQPAAVPP